MPFDVVADLADNQRSELVELYQHEWWTDRLRDSVDRMLDASDVVVGLVDSTSSELVAFARALTDGVYKGLVFGVIVSAELRGGGHDERLMVERLRRPVIFRDGLVERSFLSELVPFYERWGFSDDLYEPRSPRPV